MPASAASESSPIGRHPTSAPPTVGTSVRVFPTPLCQRWSGGCVGGGQRPQRGDEGVGVLDGDAQYPQRHPHAQCAGAPGRVDVDAHDLAGRAVDQPLAPPAVSAPTPDPADVVPGHRDDGGSGHGGPERPPHPDVDGVGVDFHVGVRPGQPEAHHGLVAPGEQDRDAQGHALSHAPGLPGQVPIVAGSRRAARRRPSRPIRSMRVTSSSRAASASGVSPVISATRQWRRTTGTRICSWWTARS